MAGEATEATEATESSVLGAVTSPLFFLHRNLGVDRTKQIKGYELIKEIQEVVQKEDVIDGIQRIGGLWRVYICDEEEKIRLTSEGFTFRGVAVNVMTENPFLRKDNSQQERQKGTKVIIQNVPLTIQNNDVEIMLKQFKVTMLSGISYEYEKDEQNQITRIKNGNRSVYLDSDMLEKNPIPRFSFCGNWRCRIQYRGQPIERKYCYRCHKEGHFLRECRNERVCSVCHEPGHQEGAEDCAAYLPNNSVAFKGNQDVLSNFYPCALKWKGVEYASAEHIYQAEKAEQNNRPEVAAEIQASETALEAKQLGKQVYAQKNWDVEHENLMYKILESKLNQLKSVRELLVSSKDNLIVESVPNEYHWSNGLSKFATVNTNPEKWPGQNVLGNMWMSIRKDLVQEADSNKGRNDKRKQRDSDSSSDNPVNRARLSGTTPEKHQNGKHDI